MNYPGRYADQRLHMFPPNRVPDERQRFSAEELEELSWIEEWQLAIICLPASIQIIPVRASIFYAVLVFVDCPTCGVGVSRPSRIGYPLPGEEIACLCCRNSDRRPALVIMAIGCGIREVGLERALKHEHCVYVDLGVAQRHYGEE